MAKKCFVPGCTTGYLSMIKDNKLAGTRNRSMFSPPKDRNTFEQWRKVIPIEDKEFTRGCSVCELHFLPKDLVTEHITKCSDGTVEKVKRGKVTLRKGAVPCIFTNLPAYLSNYIREKKKALMQEFVEARRKTNSEATKKTNSEASTKTNSEASMKTNSEASWKTFSEASRKTFSEASWKRCPEANKKTYSKACRKENSEESRKENSETEAIDLSWTEETDIDEEIRPIILSSFQDSTNDRPFITFKELSVSVTDLNSMRSTSDNSFFVLESLQDNRNIESSTTVSNFDFKYLSENLNMIKKPSKWWVITSFGDCIICAKWNTEYVTERRIVIEQDLKVKVFLKDSKIDVSSGKTVESLDNVSFLLQEVDNLYLCAGLKDENMPEKNCLLYFARKVISGIEYDLCCECRKRQRQQATAKAQQTNSILEQKQRIKYYQSRIKNERKRNVRMSRKVSRLKQLVEFLKKDHIDAKKYK